MVLSPSVIYTLDKYVAKGLTIKIFFFNKFYLNKSINLQALFS